MNDVALATHFIDLKKISNEQDGDKGKWENVCSRTSFYCKIYLLEIWALTYPILEMYSTQVNIYIFFLVLKDLLLLHLKLCFVHGGLPLPFLLQGFSIIWYLLFDPDNCLP